MRRALHFVDGLGSFRRWGGNRPVGVAELPLAIAMFRQAGEEATFGNLVAIGVQKKFMPGSRYLSEVRGERIDTQIVSPIQLDVLDHVREILDPLGGRLAAWKLEEPLRGQEKRWIVGKMFLPGGGTFLSNVMSHGGNKTAHV